MKSILIGLFLTQVVVSTAHAAESGKHRTKTQKICDSFQDVQDLECSHIMCDSDIANGTFKDLDDCTSATDYGEAAQGGCDGQSTTVESQVEDYNRLHPGAKINCD